MILTYYYKGAPMAHISVSLDIRYECKDTPPDATESVERAIAAFLMHEDRAPVENWDRVEVDYNVVLSDG